MLILDNKPNQKSKLVEIFINSLILLVPLLAYFIQQILVLWMSLLKTFQLLFRKTIKREGIGFYLVILSKFKCDKSQNLNKCENYSQNFQSRATNIFVNTQKCRNKVVTQFFENRDIYFIEKSCCGSDKRYFYCYLLKWIFTITDFIRFNCQLFCNLSHLLLYRILASI